MSSIDVAAMIPDWSPALECNDSAVARLVYHYDDADPDASALFMELLREAAAELVAAERARCAAERNRLLLALQTIKASAGNPEFVFTTARDVLAEFDSIMEQTR